ncbi:MAG: DUF411 domain-containing protein [Proteobacteria bacterium]|nr:DUF411 domain-containing protein [Pseudomonadota bacterium]
MRHVLLLLTVALAATACSDRAVPQIQVFKSPSCGCCTKWERHLEDHGFAVTSTPVTNLTAIKRARGVPEDLAACHTAVVGDYVIEGHVPAADIQRLLAEAPDVTGIAVPGMPLGSPGMEADRSEAYAVRTFGGREGRSVFATHP